MNETHKFQIFTYLRTKFFDEVPTNLTDERGMRGEAMYRKVQSLKNH